MRELTTREKVGIVVIIIAAIAALYSFGILDPAKFGFTGGELSAKKVELESTENLIAFDKLASEVKDGITNEVGLQSNLIPEPLFAKISDKLSVEKLNQAKTPNDFGEIDPMLISRAGAIFDYRKQIGGFEEIEQLKEIKCSIFEAEPAQAVISRRISELTKKAGIQPKYQLSVKPLLSKKRESISIQNRQRLVDKLYRHELGQELDSLKDQIKKENAEKKAQSVDGIRPLHEDVEVDAGNPEVAEVDDDAADRSVDEDTEGETEIPEVDDDAEKTELSHSEDEVDATDDRLEEKEKKHVPSTGEVIDQKFPPLPEEIPIKTRIELAQLILSSNYPIKRQIASNVRLKQLLDTFQMPEDEKPLNLKPFMSNYVKQVEKAQKELIGWLKATPTSYSKQAYYVEMLSVKGELGQLVKFIHSIESSSRFFQIRDFQLTIADKRKTTLNANIKIIATVL